MRDRGDHWGYAEIMAVELLFFSQHPDMIMEPFKEIQKYNFKGV